MKIKFVTLIFMPVLANADENNSILTNLCDKNFGFIENKGQIVDLNGHANPGVKYLLCRPGFNVQLRKNGFSYDTYIDDTIIDNCGKRSWNSYNKKVLTEEISPGGVRNYHRVDIELLHCNANPEVKAFDTSSTYLNYFTTETPEGGVSNVRFYQRVIYKNIYKNIDLEFFVTSQERKAGKMSGVEYDFIVHPGGNLSDIQLSYKGAYKTWLDKKGELNIKIASGTFTEYIPRSYIKESNEPIDINYISLGENSYGFYTSDNISAKSDLIIDPTPSLTWATYYNGTLASNAEAIVLDGSGNVYISGSTKSTTNIATAGAYQTVFGGGNYDVFVAEFNSTGTILIWATYYGGTGDDYSFGMSIDGSNNTYIAGSTRSTSAIATAGAYQTVIGGGEDAFVAEFNATGTALIWGTYYGGPGDDRSYRICMDAGNNTYITGSAGSISAIATAGTYQTVKGGSADAFVAKFNSAGTALTWATYYGGTALDEGRKITIDASNNVYITGYTNSTGSIATAGAYQTTIGGTQDVFAAKFNSTGTALTWGTYYGGTGTETDGGITIDGSDNVYITGYTNSATAIATAGAYQTTYGKGTDGFIAKFNSSGSFLTWGTYYGGSGTEQPLNIALDASNNVFIVGYTTSTDSIATAGAYQTTNGGGGDAFIAKVNSAGTRLSWGTYYGGTALDVPKGLTIDPTDNVYVTGYTNSTSAIATAGTYQTAKSGTTDNFIAKFGGFISGLPIELLSFTAEALNDYVQLNWITATETNNDYFTVERTVDTKTYENVTKIKGAGNSTQVLNYKTNDPEPLIGHSYYRLKQTDFDGNYTYSQIISINFANTGISDFLVYPNPIYNLPGNLSFTLSGLQKDSSILVVLLDVLGKEYYSKIVLSDKNGCIKIVIESSISLSNGVYMIRAANENKLFSKKIVVE